MKLEVGKTYIDNTGFEWECLLEHKGWFYCDAPRGDGNDLFAFDEDYPVEYVRSPFSIGDGYGGGSVFNLSNANFTAVGVYTQRV